MYFPLVPTRWKHLSPYSWLLGLLSMLLFSCILASIATKGLIAQELATSYQIGLGKSDITPNFPVRLSGFGGRRTEHEGVRQSIYAKCMAIAGKESSAIHLLYTIDNLGAPDRIRRETLSAVQKKYPRVQTITICSTHTHTAPMLTNVCPTLFGVAIPEEHQQHIDQYTELVRSALVDSATQAIEGMEPSTLQSGVGLCTFAANRRTAGGPVDHDLPFLVVRGERGEVRAIFTSYACHCVTLSDNLVSGDWAGYAQEAIERRFPGAMAMVAIGCGADSNPSSGVTGDRADIAALQGAEISDSISHCLRGYLQPVDGKIEVQSKTIQLPLQELPTRERWQELGKRDDAIGYHARYQIAKLDRGESIRTHIPYEIQTIQFGSQLAMVFLPGEVVVDYATKIKQRFDSSRVWVHGYSNDSPCYIPSERVLREGGYEGGGAMVYYDVPVPFAVGLEEKILSTVQSIISEKFLNPFDTQKTLGSIPSPPSKAAQLAKVSSDLEVQLVASEPLITSPVAIDFGPDGRLWVADMSDYPGPNPGEGAIDDPLRPRGRIRVLRDTDGDGMMDQSALFAANIPFPTGVTVWRDGVLVCAAPSILYLPDIDHDDHADRMEVLATGFGTDNYQGRVNSLEYGLDGWLYGSCGLFGGQIRDGSNHPILELGDRDFRFQPDTKRMEPASGRTQQGRVRNDFDEWFGCDNSDLGRHYPIADHYVQRNPYVAPLQIQQHLVGASHGGQLFPANPNAQRFQLSGPLGRATAACGIGIYRDRLLGEAYYGDLFTCEPVNLLIHRMHLQPVGSTFEGQRSKGEERTEFLTSSDPWFRPVQIRTGPDGALWVVDMSRYIIEHPRWIPENDRKQLDPQAGSHLGRIYRIVPRHSPTRSWQHFQDVPIPDLARLLETSNGWQRDMATQQIRWRLTPTPSEADVDPIVKRQLVNELRRLLPSSEELTRMHAYVLIDAFDTLTEEEWTSGFLDSSPEVRRLCIRLFEKQLMEETDRPIPSTLAMLVSDPNRHIQMQLACSLGYSHHDTAAQVLYELATAAENDPFLWTAIRSSFHRQNVKTIAHRAAESMANPNHAFLAMEFWNGLFQTSHGVDESSALEPIGRSLVDSISDEVSELTTTERVYRYEVFLALATSCSTDWTLVTSDRHLQVSLTKSMERIKNMVGTEAEERAMRIVALRLLAFSEDDRLQDLERLVGLLDPSSDLHREALQRLSEIDDARIPILFGESWQKWTPATQTQTIDLLLARPSWTGALLNLLESDKIPWGRWNATQRQRLTSIDDSLWRDRIEKIVAEKQVYSSNDDRKEVIKSLETSIRSLTGNVEVGQRLFKTRCGVCHRLQGQGFAVGPDLDMVASKNRDFFLTEIFDPNRNCDSRYTQQIVATLDGRVLAGIVSEDAVSVSIREQGGKETIVLRNELESFKATGKSLMPEGLEKDLTAQDTVDIITYIQQVPIPYKHFPGNEPQTIRLLDGRYKAKASMAEIRGQDVVFETTFGNIGYWHGVDDYAKWTLEIQKSGNYDVYLDYANANDAGNQLRLEIDDASINHSVHSTSDWSQYRLFSLGRIPLEKGMRQLSIRPIAPLNGPLIDLRNVYFVPEGSTIEDLQERLTSPESFASAEEVAQALLSPRYAEKDKTRWIEQWTEKAGEVLVCLTSDIGVRTDEEYRRIPMIWRLGIASSRKNQTETLKRVLQVSLPEVNESLRHWQAVVLGGSIINGLSLEGQSPRERMEQLMLGDEPLRRRWLWALEQAVEMHSDATIATGTRYDLLRMIAMIEEDRAMKILPIYLQAKTDAELQMGAVSALADVGTLAASTILRDAMHQLTPPNQKIAEAAIAKIEHEE